MHPKMQISSTDSEKHQLDLNIEMKAFQIFWEKGQWRRGLTDSLPVLHGEQISEW